MFQDETSTTRTDQRNDDIYFATVAELHQLLRAKKISAVELTKIFLERLGELGPHYNALAELTPELALAQARRADRTRARGQSDSPLLGIPYGAKDLLATKSIPTRWGAPPLRDQVFDYDATVVRRLAQAGAVLIGKLAMVELAGGGTYEYPSASLHGPGLNPWNRGHWSGGSSSGSGSAVAAGLVPFALGSETWGSIVTPATYCGITGLRPTWGLVSRYGAMELAWSMDKVGPLAHSAQDCGYVLQAIAGHDPNDFTTVKPGFHLSPTRRGSFRLGILPADFSGQPELEGKFQMAVRVLRRLGMRTRDIQLPSFPYDEIARTILHGETAAAHGDFIASPKVEELADRGQITGLKATLTHSAQSLALAYRSRRQLVPQVLALFDRVDVLVTPALLNEALTLETNLQARFNRRGGYSVLGALCGVPSLTMPIGLSANGLPLGLSIIGNRFAENTLLRIGMLFQRETDWHRARPPVTESVGWGQYKDVHDE
jgi:aspartyl-tRNA(Asn)/glutamyl-tRNA(Gln) amidotransferase subunit A